MLVHGAGWLSGTILSNTRIANGIRTSVRYNAAKEGILATIRYVLRSSQQMTYTAMEVAKFLGRTEVLGSLRMLALGARVTWSHYGSNDQLLEALKKFTD